MKPDETLLMIHNDFNIQNFNLIDFIFLLPHPSICQSNFKSGLYINKSGDTIRGFIDYREWYENPKSVKFRNNFNDQDFILLRPGMINGFQVGNGTLYQGADVSLTMDSSDPTQPSKIPPNMYFSRGIFLKVLVNGSKYRLYKYTDSIKTRYFFLKVGDSVPIELGYHFVFTRNILVNFFIDYGFREQIFSFTAVNKTLTKKIQS